ncbi:Kcnh6, partial [Symbiodinium microadriaticum]
MFNKEFLLFSELQRHFHPFLAESGELIVNENDHCSDIFFVIHGCVEGMKRVKHTSVPDDGLQALVGVWTDGSHFGIGTAMLTEGTYWAKHISKTVSDMVWIDLSTLSLSPATGAILKAAAQLEVNNHAVIQSQLKNTLMDEEGNCFTPLMIFNEKVLTSNEYKERGLMNRGSEKSMYRSSSDSESLKNDCTDTCYDDLTYRVVRLTGEVINGHREYEVVLETTLDMLKRGVINPHWRVKMYYDLFIIVCTIVSVFTLPLRFGFNIPDSTGWIVYDVIIEMAFLSDMGLEFVTAYERSDFLLNTEHKFIALNYIKGWFILDLIAGFPFSLMLADSQLTLLKLFKLFRIIRIMRILKVLK